MFRTRSQLPFGSSAARPIVVNQYSLYTESSSDQDLLLRGRLAVGHDILWINPNRGLRGTLAGPAQIWSTAFELGWKPPKNNTERSLLNFSEWDGSIGSSDDIFSLDELQEFKNTDLSFLFLGNTKRLYSEGSLQERAPKRRKLDVASLRNVIPQPHVLPTIASVSTKKSSITAYSKSEPFPIPPHTLPLPDPLPYTRRSWVIPVRGSLPWQHATSAVVLLDSTDTPEPADPNAHEEIVWTAAALGSFWSFLLLLRDKSTVGPLGLSFHVSQNVTSNLQPTYPELSGMGAQPLTQNTEAAASTMSSLRPVAIPLTFIDHIKVYHDAAQSMQLRNLLDAWAFENGEAGTSRIRLLKGSRLVLLDERAKGIFVS
ncbi:hypothetical protein MVEN_01791900 [Mycena venus]|uniref:Uncharacterized protein n=1 Tax=Mycena venus TaxID=2733690 RepID=A0A8H6XK97_9AGAR|nr:hypothetical protein MVEN_01791900 [Mycena venus]